MGRKKVGETRYSKNIWGETVAEHYTVSSGGGGGSSDSLSKWGILAVIPILGLILFGVFTLLIAISHAIADIVSPPYFSTRKLRWVLLIGVMTTFVYFDFCYSPSDRPISSQRAGFTPGAYKRANPEATDGAEVIASFLLFTSEGKFDEAKQITYTPYSSSFEAHANGLIRAYIKIFEESPGLRKAIIQEGVTVSRLVDQESGRIVRHREGIVRGKRYSAVAHLGDRSVLLVIVKTPQGWKITPL